VVNGLPVVPAIVTGDVRHSRVGSTPNAFSHRAYQWLVDLDALPRQPWILRPFATFSSADHFGDPRASIKHNVEQYLALHDVTLGEGGRILMLANARVLGYVFNPISVFWCFDKDGALACIVAEVHNTYGERHAYLLRPDNAGIAKADKTFYVSPFFEVDGSYTLTFALRPDLVAAAVALHRAQGVAFRASFGGAPRPASTRRVVAHVLKQPFMPQRVSILIRLHGIRLWLRGLPVAPRPRPTSQEAR
jgi:DUF1365 family protein